MNILSYNIYGVKDTKLSIPKWEIRQNNLKRIINKILCKEHIELCCFQEVNKNNLKLLENILDENNYRMLEKFPMKTKSYEQYNIIAIKNDNELVVNFIYCLPHGNDLEYKKFEEQKIDYGMSDYRTTVFISIIYKGKKYLVGNIHADHISIYGKIKGIVKSLNYMDYFNYDYKILVGDMNMISYMSEAYNILKQKPNYITLSKNKVFDIMDNSFHGYGLKEQINIDFAFIEKNKRYNYNYKIIKQDNFNNEGSDHRPIIISII